MEGIYPNKSYFCDFSSSGDVNHWFLADQPFAHFPRGHLLFVEVLHHNFRVDLHGDYVRVVNLERIGSMLSHGKSPLLLDTLSDESC